MGKLDKCDNAFIAGYKSQFLFNDRMYEYIFLLLCYLFTNLYTTLYVIYISLSSSQLIVLFCISNKICWMFCFTVQSTQICQFDRGRSHGFCTENSQYM